MISILEGPVSSLALCWRIERADGAGLALTSHDAELTIGGRAHEAAPGMRPAAIQHAAGLEPNGSEVAGAITSAAISEVDLVLGRWDNARVMLSAVDWEQPGLDELQLLQGELGELRFEGQEFRADLRGAAARLEAAICPETSPECRAELGDKRCSVDLAGRRLQAIIEATEDSEILLDQPVGEDFLWGRTRFLSGASCGLVSVLVRIDANRILLRDPMRTPIAAGDRIELRHGCDKSFATCATRFGNAANFRGEPHLPGDDLLTRYPGA